MHCRQKRSKSRRFAMKWFKHYSDLPRDEGVSRYLDAAGKDRVTAYGFLMFLLEAIASRMDASEGHLVCSASYSIAHWGRITYSHANRVGKYLRLCEVIGWVLVEFEEGMCKVSVPRMVELRDERTRKSGVLPEQVAQSREDKTRKEKRESTQKGPLSDCLKAGTQGRCAPPDFEVTEVLQEWAATNYPSVPIEKETAKFKNHEYRTARSDWSRAWKFWIIRAAEHQEKTDGSADHAGRNEQLLKLAVLYDLERRPNESESDFCNRIDDANQRRIQNQG